jgi:hypothetical protein
MLRKSVIACLAAAACVATTALMPTVASAGRGGPMYGTWNWPPYAAPACGYVWVNSYGPVAGNGFTSVTRRKHGPCHKLSLLAVPQTRL